MSIYNCADCCDLIAEVDRLTRKVEDLERIAACAENMRDASDAEVARLRAAYSKFVSYASHGKRGDIPTWYVPQWQLEELSAAFHPHHAPTAEEATGFDRTADRKEAVVAHNSPPESINTCPVCSGPREFFGDPTRAMGWTCKCTTTEGA